MKLLHYFLVLFLISSSMAKNSIKSKNKFANTQNKAKYSPKDDFETIMEPKIGPGGMPYNMTTSCETFGKYARFNPHSIVRLKWFVFYYWSNPQDMKLYEFRIPNKKDLKLLHNLLDGHMPKRFSWSSTLVLQKNLLTNVTTLLQEKGDRGEYIEYEILHDIPEGNLTFFRNIRIKQTGDNKYLAIMICKDHTAVIMSQLHMIPRQHNIQVEAARLGYRGRKGKSYLYQGHEWMPIPEQDEREFWVMNKRLMDL